MNGNSRVNSETLDTVLWGVIDSKGAACNCLVGEPYIDSTGNCRCATNETVPIQPINTTGFNNQSLNNRLMQWLESLQSNAITTKPLQQTGMVKPSFDVSAFLQNNKLLIAGIVLGIGYFAFSGGGKFAGKTRTDVTRWGG